MTATVLDLAYGATTLHVETRARVTRVVAPGSPPVTDPVRRTLERALDNPTGSRRLEDRARAGDRVTLIVSDATRDEPRRELVDAVRARLPDVRLTLAIATGTHGPSGGLGAVGLAGAGLDGVPVVDHDGHSGADLVLVGETARGTPVRVHRCVVEADLVVATGVIRPHYFAGWGAGAKAIFPGLAGAVETRINHRLKEHPSARPGAVEDNLCRLDLEEAAELASPRSFLLDGIADATGRVRGAVAGDLREAFRRGVEVARSWVTSGAKPSPFIVVTDRPPVTDSLYQASKLVAAVAPLLTVGGTILLVAPCGDGIGPVDVVNRGIYEIGLRPRLPSGHQILLLSDLSAAEASRSYARAATIDAIRDVPELLLVPGASKLVLDVDRT